MQNSDLFQKLIDLTPTLKHSCLKIPSKYVFEIS